MTEIKFTGEIGNLEIMPGDKFVMTTDLDLTWQQRDQLATTWKEFAGDEAKLLVLTPGLRLSVIRYGKGPSPDADPSTGRPYGDHGTAMQAIEFALDKLQVERDTFLNSWREGDLDEWPEFYAWLSAAEITS